MDSAKRSVAFVVILAWFGVCLGAVYKVGDSTGWTSLGNIDYAKWASSNNFHVGDSLLFEYNKQFHNVKQVTHNDFQSCNATSAIASYTSGSDTITIRRPGHFYFLCGFPGHCQVGQKVDILVTPSLSSTGPSASPAPSSLGSSPAYPPSQMLAPAPAQGAAVSLNSSKLSLALSLVAIICVFAFAF